MYRLGSNPYRLETFLMPTYEFRCNDDKTMLEIQQGFHDGNIPACPLCGKNMTKVYAPILSIFRGSGFYKTDNK
jgi:putative FmdB family regulatory protein